jgi:hypothetical protein
MELTFLRTYIHILCDTVQSGRMPELLKRLVRKRQVQRRRLGRLIHSRGNPRMRDVPEDRKVMLQ